MFDIVKFVNVYSMGQATLKLRPFSLLIGANGAGKSNVLRALQGTAKAYIAPHFNHWSEASQVYLHDSTLKRKASAQWRQMETGVERATPEFCEQLSQVRIFKLVPSRAGQAEALVANPAVAEDGSGVVQVLDSLKTGDREDLFDTIEARLCEYIPEIEKLSFIPGRGDKMLQVREKHIQTPVPVSELSDGTQLIIILLTLLHQERPPSLICIEDIDSALHPLLLEKVIHLCFDLAGKEGRPPIIATTQNPYVVDLFKDREDAVVVVEKVDGYTTLETLEEKMESLANAEAPLGELWFSGVVGGVPPRAVA